MTASARLVAVLRTRRGGAPMEALDEAELRPGVGIAGDRYGEGRGRWSDHRWDEVTLVAEEAAEEAAAVLGTAVDPAALRRNLVTRGVDLGTLEGRRFTVGSALLEGLRPCDPCRYLEELLDIPGLKAALRGRGGLRARVVEAGRVRPGDRVQLQPEASTK